MSEIELPGKRSDGRYVYTLNPGQTYSAEDLRRHLVDEFRRLLGPDADRLKALDVAVFIPSCEEDFQQLDARGLPHGPVFQVLAHLITTSNVHKDQLVRFHIPARMKWEDLPKMIPFLATALQNCIKRMRQWEREATADLLTSPLIEPAPVQAEHTELAASIAQAIDKAPQKAAKWLH